MPAPRLRFPGFEGEWEEKKLGEYLTESRLVGSDGAKARKITVKLWGKGVYEKQDRIQGSENTKYFKRKAGQLIYSKLDFLNGAFGLIPPELDGLESTLDLPCFDFSKDLHPNYILEYISREEFYSKFEGGALGGRKARRVTPEEFLNTSVPLPSLPEQARIAAALSSLDAVIAAHQSRQDALREHKRGLLAGLFPAEGEQVPRLRFPEFEGAGEWEEKKLGEVAEVVRGGSPRPIDAYMTTASDGLNWLKIGDVDKEAKYISGTREKVIKSALNRTRQIHSGDLILSNSMSFGRPYISEISACIHDGWIAITNINDSTLSEFLYYYISSESSQSYFFSKAAGSGVKNLNADLIKALPVSIPSLPEQTRIAAALSSLDDLITAQGDKIAALLEFKQGLLRGLFPAVGNEE
ncbi:restriction endonuclease subunit S [Deinococcus yunweiensis]|uniref:restriction endonuclease subunit S n=1 Tax=Deinococcus yunweiensis TaxID=367282 RepID=UPI00398E688C